MATATRSAKDYAVGLSALALVVLVTAAVVALVGWFLVSLVANEWVYLAPAVGIALIALAGTAIKNATR